jgi:ribosomal protein S12 methylthiotransferase
MVDGPAEEDGHWLEGRHEGLAPEIDGVVYINGSDNPSVPGPGACVKVQITDATTYDLSGHLLGEASASEVQTPGGRGPRGGYR